MQPILFGRPFLSQQPKPWIVGLLCIFTSPSIIPTCICGASDSVAAMKEQFTGQLSPNKFIGTKLPLEILPTGLMGRVGLPITGMILA